MQVPYYTAAAVRELDRLAIEEHGIPGIELMQRAGQSAFNALRWQWPEVRRLLMFCGTGNNGGDGFIVAGLARAAGLDVLVQVIGTADSMRGTALQALVYAQEQSVELQFSTESAAAALAVAAPDTVVVDGLLGTGLNGPVRPQQRQVIESINACGLPVLALDLPSGLCSDTGAVLGACVQATLTVTFIGRKLGLVTGAGPAHCGKVLFDDLGVPAEIYRQVEAAEVA
jgi:ADP-dependent NAD(P)H-hydrate dehydratase / NAD(P)H-hydrate epimerase